MPAPVEPRIAAQGLSLPGSETAGCVVFDKWLQEDSLLCPDAPGLLRQQRDWNDNTVRHAHPSLAGLPGTQPPPPPPCPFHLFSSRSFPIPMSLARGRLHLPHHATLQNKRKRGEEGREGGGGGASKQDEIPPLIVFNEPSQLTLSLSLGWGGRILSESPGELRGAAAAAEPAWRGPAEAPELSAVLNALQPASRPTQPPFGCLLVGFLSDLEPDVEPTSSCGLVAHSSLCYPWKSWL